MYSPIYSSGKKSDPKQLSLDSQRLSPRLFYFQRRSLDSQRPSSQLFNFHRRSLNLERPRPSLDSDSKSLFNLSDSVLASNSLAPDNRSNIDEYDCLNYKIDNIAHHIEKELINIADKLEQINLRLNLLQGALENDIAHKSGNLAKLNKSLTKTEVTNTAYNPSKTIDQDPVNSNSNRIDRLDCPSQALGYKSVGGFFLVVQQNLQETSQSFCDHVLGEFKKTPSPPPSPSPSRIDSDRVNKPIYESSWVL